MHCVSYAPFRGAQNPFGPDVPIDPRQIEADLAQLKQITDCIRTYSTDHGLDQIPEIARRHGIKVMQGLWLSSRPDLTRKQIETGIALAKRYPDVIQAIVVGNEVLLRGEMGAPELARTIREVKAQVSMPVTYADVWEFWLRNREVAAAVDFITIHILPYWEDFPIPAKDAARHVDAIRQQVVAAFPGREIFIGEFGWPSAGRMREGALPSPANQALHHSGGGGAGQAQELPRQPDRGLRPALEAPARRHGRRPLGPLRRLPTQSRSSPGARRFPIIRTGRGRRPAASASRR